MRTRTWQSPRYPPPNLGITCHLGRDRGVRICTFSLQVAKADPEHGASALRPSSVVRRRPVHLTQAESRTRPTRILLVADAQVPMPLAHSQTSTGLFNDIYTHRAWKVTRHMHPDLVIFLGDMLRTGRFVESDDE